MHPEDLLHKWLKAIFFGNLLRAENTTCMNWLYQSTKGIQCFLNILQDRLGSSNNICRTLATSSDFSLFQKWPDLCKLFLQWKIQSSCAHLITNERPAALVFAKHLQVFWHITFHKYKQHRGHLLSMLWLLNITANYCCKMIFFCSSLSPERETR